jgi:tetratricopeptide (TPR) repeat protein
MMQRWETERQQLEDRLAAGRAQALFDEIEILDQLARAEPDRIWLDLQLSQRRDALAAQRSALLQCADRQLEHALELAQRCSGLAGRIAEDANSQALAEVVAQRVAEYEAAAKARALQAAAQRRARLLDQAEQDFAGGDYVAAAAAVAEVLVEVPDDPRALRLQTRFTGTINSQAEVLNTLADRLYAEGQIDAALQVWESSLAVAPAQPDIVERAERARRVQERLRQLRSTPETEVAPPETGQ